jgi:hypothetical protein
MLEAGAAKRSHAEGMDSWLVYYICDGAWVWERRGGSDLLSMVVIR